MDSGEIIEQPKEAKNLYINLIKLILHNIKDLERIRRVYTYAQTLWLDEEAQDPGG